MVQHNTLTQQLTAIPSSNRWMNTPIPWALTPIRSRVRLYRPTPYLGQLPCVRAIIFDTAYQPDFLQALWGLKEYVDSLRMDVLNVESTAWTSILRGWRLATITYTIIASLNNKKGRVSVGGDTWTLSSDKSAEWTKMRYGNSRVCIRGPCAKLLML